MKKILSVMMVIMAACYIYSQPKMTEVYVNKTIQTNQINKSKKTMVSKIKKEPIQYSEEIKATEPYIVFSESLTLELVEVINPMKWKYGVSEFSGTLLLTNGRIDSLNVQIMDNYNIDIYNAEMSGNTFKCVENDEEFHGLMYQTDQNYYMVSFDSGKYEGTRLRFQKVQNLIDNYEPLELGYNFETEPQY